MYGEKREKEKRGERVKEGGAERKGEFTENREREIG